MIPLRLHVDRFNAELLYPARDRREELRGQVTAAERELEALIRSRVFDDAAAEEAQRRLEQLQFALARWARRYEYLTSAENTRDAGDYMTLDGMET